jgi:hypothetical protein
MSIALSELVTILKLTRAIISDHILLILRSILTLEDHVGLFPICFSSVQSWILSCRLRGRLATHTVIIPILLINLYRGTISIEGMKAHYSC